MKYQEFRLKLQGTPIFRSNIFPSITDNVNQLRVQVNQWVKKGYIHELKRGVYCLNSRDQEKKYSKDYIANQIYTPSYIALETAMQHYGFIPEAVRVYMSITTKKTNYFENDLGRFYYYHVKPSLFTGFSKRVDSYGNYFFISEPEKTLLDFIYLRTKAHPVITRDLLEEGYRLQHLDSIDVDKLIDLSELYSSKKVSKAAKVLREYILEEWKND
jgi:hypothetical protein